MPDTCVSHQAAHQTVGAAQGLWGPVPLLWKYTVLLTLAPGCVSWCEEEVLTLQVN